MKGRDIMVFYNRDFALSTLVHANHEFLEGGTPDVTWQIQKLLILEAEALMRRDPNRATRLDGLASRKKPLAAPAAPAADKPPADKSTDKSTITKKKSTMQDVQEHRGVQVRRLLQVRTYCTCGHTCSSS